MKVAGVGGPQTPNRPLPSCPRRGKFGVDVSHAARILEIVVNFQVGGQAGRWAEGAFDDFTVESGNEHVFQCQFAVGHAARFDCDTSDCTPKKRDEKQDDRTHRWANSTNLGIVNWNSPHGYVSIAKRPPWTRLRLAGTMVTSPA